MLHNHQIDLETVEIVDRSSLWRQRLILEAWHSVRDGSAINEHIALPNILNNIKNFQSQQEYSRDYCSTLKKILRDLVLSHIVYIYQAGRHQTFACFFMVAKAAVLAETSRTVYFQPVSAFEKYFLTCLATHRIFSLSH